MTVTATEPYTRARRGDGVVIGEIHRDYVIGQASREYQTYELGIVTSVTRDGLVKCWRPAWVSESDTTRSIPVPARRTGLWVLPASSFDVPAGLKTARAHVWPGHTTVKPYESLGELRAAMAPHRK